MLIARSIVICNSRRAIGWKSSEKNGIECDSIVEIRTEMGQNRVNMERDRGSIFVSGARWSPDSDFSIGASCRS